MKHLLTLTLLFTLLISCQKNESKTPAKAPKTAVTIIDKDKNEIEKLVKGMYRWQKKRQSLLHEFRCFVKDTVVVGLDPISHSLYLKSLHDSGFFSGEFRGNMTRIFKKQDELVRSKKVEWYTTEMGPFDSGANPWCNCQDELSYDEISLHFEKIDTTGATFYWNWEGVDDSWAKHHYAMRTVKENGKWKIAYMQGWDYEENTKPRF